MVVTTTATPSTRDMATSSAQGGRLVGKSILISGAAQGIGRASALVFIDIVVNLYMCLQVA